MDDVCYRYYCRGNANVDPNDSHEVINHYELDGNEASPGDDNAYDSVKPSEPTASTSKPPENTMPSVYAVVDKENKDGKTVRTSLKYFKPLGLVVGSANSTIHRVAFFC